MESSFRAHGSSCLRRLFHCLFVHRGESCEGADYAFISSQSSDSACGGAGYSIFLQPSNA